MSKQFYVYIIASKRNGTLYVGVTSDIVERMWEHKEGLVEGFTKQYGVKTLGHCEVHGSSQAAITSERQMTGRNRRWASQLIEKGKARWDDPYDKIVL